MTRRIFVASSLAAPALLTGATRSWAEVEKILASGNVKGKLSKDDLPTPSLLLDLDLFEANVQKMAAHAKARGRALRPHAKTHKCSELAKYLMSQGAVGACSAKISEAEALAAGGVTGLLVTGSLAGRHRIERGIALAAKRPETIFVVDNTQNAQDLNDAAAAAKQKINVAIDLLVGRRTGITPGEPALGLARAVAQMKNLKLAGIQAYSGFSAHVQGFEKRRATSTEWMGQAVATRRLFEKDGIPCPWLSGGSTGTYNIDSEIDGVTELQPGSYVFMDQGYGSIGSSTGTEKYSDFAHSLTVVASVYSKPSDDIAVVDAGLKAFATDSGGTPESVSHPGVPYAWAGDEHGRLDLKKAPRAINLGDRVEFTVTHCDPTVNLYDRIFCHRGGQVEKIWRINARGMSQ
ncbi:MAG: DSD1 family PLP-dependent enzyme [Acidobacteria bacterium]|nr:DSD1 family PLP-dependent enzyme [Acidobacteriota bacterium]